MNRQTARSPLRCLSGQALTEFVLLAGAMALFLVLLPVLSKYQDVSHSTQMASRYLAFDAAANGGQHSDFSAAPDAQAAVQRRFFAESSGLIVSAEVADQAADQRNGFWTLPNGESLLPDRASVAALSSMSAGPASSLFTLRSLMGLSNAGLVTADVTVPLARMPGGISVLETLSTMDVELERRMVMMVNPWPASGYAVTNGVVARSTDLQTGLVSALNIPTGLVVEVLDPGLSAPQVGNLARWEAVVPTDRRR